MVEEFGLTTEPLLRLAAIVRGADTGRMDIAPQAAGLLAASLGLSRMFADDLAQLEAGMSLYDAFYRWCRDAARRNPHRPFKAAAEASIAATDLRPRAASIRHGARTMRKRVFRLDFLHRRCGRGRSRRSLRLVVPGLSSARTEPPAAETAIATWLLHQSVPTAAKMAPIRWAPIPPMSRRGGTSIGRNANSATPMTAAAKRLLAPANIRVRRRCARPPLRRCPMARFSITSAMASVTPRCRPGACRTAKSGSS